MTYPSPAEVSSKFSAIADDTPVDGDHDGAQEQLVAQRYNEARLANAAPLLTPLSWSAPRPATPASLSPSSQDAAQTAVFVARRSPRIARGGLLALVLGGVFGALACWILNAIHG
ncbi:MAG: hypothetical protein R3B48_15035 [Kofleriaceae bacterium]